MSVDVGDHAPDFTLRDQDGQEVALSSYRGSKNVVLVFYPLAFSRVCSGELCALRDELTDFQSPDVQVLTVSVDSMFSHRAWAQQERFGFPLLSDFWPHGQVAQQYGVFDEERGVAQRGTFVIDKDGVVRWKVVNAIPDARDLEDYRNVLATLS